MLKSKSVSKDDLPEVESLLKSNKLCFNDINEHGVYMYSVESDSGHIGYFGYEIYGANALFRSMVVNDDNRGSGYGSEILKLAIDSLRKEKVKEVYLLTNTAAEFFEKQGFERYERSAVPKQIAETSEFVEFCPQDSICMHFKID